MDVRAEERVVDGPFPTADPRQLLPDLHARVVDVDPVPPALFVSVKVLKVRKCLGVGVEMRMLIDCLGSGLRTEVCVLCVKKAYLGPLAAGEDGDLGQHLRFIIMYEMD